MTADWQVIYGPPGTGKTHELMRLLSLELEDGMEPDRIGYVAFTRKAAAEAQSRLPVELEWCRTLHSLAFRWHGLTRKDVMTDEHLRQFADEHGYRFTGKRDEITGLLAMRDDNILLNAVTLARQLKRAPGEVLADLGAREPSWRAEELALQLDEFRAREHLWDYTDMLERLEDGPELDVLFVDEAQDLTPLQWDVVRMLARGCRRVYVAGDDDQAIYEWAGADVRQFIRLEGERRVLTKSRRVPQAVQELAERVASGISERVPKAWSARAERGTVELGADLDAIDPAEGTWMFLARTHRAASPLAAHLRRCGRLYVTASGPSVRDEDWGAIRTWERLRKGREARVVDVRAVYDLMVAGQHYERGAKKRLADAPDDDLVGMGDLRERFGLLVDAPWYEALVRLGREQIDYLRQCLANGEKKPRCYVGTIHSVKGGEADHVVICPDVPARVDVSSDAEKRVWYVGLTRARKTVRVLRPQDHRAMLF